MCCLIPKSIHSIWHSVQQTRVASQQQAYLHSNDMVRLKPLSLQLVARAVGCGSSPSSSSLLSRRGGTQAFPYLHTQMLIRTNLLVYLSSSTSLFDYIPGKSKTVELWKRQVFSGVSPAAVFLSRMSWDSVSCARFIGLGSTREGSNVEGSPMEWRQSPQEMTRGLDPNIGVCMCPAEVHTVLSGHTPTQAQGLPLAGMSPPDSLSFPMFSNRTQPTLCSLPTSTQ